MKVNIKNKELILKYIPIVGVISSISYYTLQGSNLYFSLLKVLLIVTLLCGCISIYKDKKISIKAIALLFFLMFLYIKLKDTRLIVAFFTIACAKTIKFENLIKIVFYTNLTCFLLSVISGGYHHINGFGLHFSILMMLMCYAMKDKKIKYFNIIMVLLYLIMGLITTSGSFIICGIIFCLLIMTQNKLLNKRIIYSKYIPYIFVICFIFNLIGAIYINVGRFQLINNITPGFLSFILEKIFGLVDILTTSRIQLANQSLFMFGFSLFGGNVDYTLLSNTHYFNLDSGYMWLLQGFGIIMTIIFLYYTVTMLKQAQRHKDNYIIYISIIIALWAINEDILLNIGLNLSMILYSKYLNEKLEERSNGNTKNNSLLLVWGESTTRVGNKMHKFMEKIFSRVRNKRVERK